MDKLIVETVYGKVRGKKEGNIYVWKGVPYAKPPIGNLRFQPPQEPVPWEGVRDASSFSPICPQPESSIMGFLGTEKEKMSENCLHLNIWSPSPDNSRRPVLVWIHGGAFLYGSGSNSWYNGSSFASLGNVVVVTVNYRLGPFGFLYLGGIGGDDYALSGNCGLLDQIQALKWIKENISSFGGDPDNVTIFGESAGAMSIGALLGMPDAKGLFQQAILQSGAASHAIPKEKADHIARKILASLNINETNLSSLIDLPASDLVKASLTVPMMSLSPVIDGISLPKSPLTAIGEGSAKDVAVLIGTNKDEYTLFTNFDPNWKNADDQAAAALFEKHFRPDWDIIANEYKLSKDLNVDIFNHLMTMKLFVYPAVKLAENQTKQGGKVWVYRFDWESAAYGGALKSAHALEIPFVWNTLNAPQTKLFTGQAPNLEKMASIMHNTWIAFAKSGDPNNDLLPEWPEFNLSNYPTMILNEESTITNDPYRDDRIKWENIMNESALNK